MPFWKSLVGLKPVARILSIAARECLTSPARSGRNSVVDDEPVIFDLVDNYTILNRHFRTRRKIYQDHGGIVCNYDLSQMEQII